MKLEPLKDKLHNWIKNEDFDGKAPIIRITDDIKSAVEWLGEEDTFDKAKFLQFDIDIKELFKRLDENRNKAFEDVTK